MKKNTNKSKYKYYMNATNKKYYAHKRKKNPYNTE